MRKFGKYSTFSASGLILALLSTVSSAETPDPEAAVRVDVPAVRIHKVAPQNTKLWVSWESPKGSEKESKPAVLEVVGELKTDRGDLKDGEVVTGWDTFVRAGVVRNAGEAAARLWVNKDGLVSEIVLEPGENLFIGWIGLLTPGHTCECHCSCNVTNDPSQVHQETYSISFACPPSTPAPPTIPPPNPWNECVAANGDRCIVNTTLGVKEGVNQGCTRVWVPIVP